MYTGYIVKANEKSLNEIANKTIKGFNYENTDVICIEYDGELVEIETVAMSKQIIGIEESEELSDEEILEKFLEMKNKTE